MNITDDNGGGAGSADGSADTRNPVMPTRRARIALACLAGLAAYLIAATTSNNDFTLHWWAGRALLEGKSPYAVINAISPAYP
jgi:hypothetical protein